MARTDGRAEARRLERVRSSPQFDGNAFVNAHPLVRGFGPGTDRPSLRDFLCGVERRVPGGPLPVLDPVARWRRPPESGLRVTWLGHSTLLIEIDGRRVLTDPVWGARVSPLAFVGPKRFHPTAVPLAALPALDAVLVSHDHYDHLDRPTIRALAGTPVPFITSLGVGAHLEAWGIAPSRITELDWWDSTELPGGLTITAAPAQHFSGRGLKDRNATLWSSLHLRGPVHSVYYGADSGLSPHFAEVARRLGPFDLSALEIGAYHPAWGDIHMGPDNALAAHAQLGSGALLPIHWGTFNLAMHPWDEPADTIFRRGAEGGVPLMMPRIGEPVEPARIHLVTPWWQAVTGSARTVASRTIPEGDDPLLWLPD